MEKLKRLLSEIAYTRTPSPLHFPLLPLLSFASSLYSFSLFIRGRLYHLGIFSKRRLPVPVISVGNLTWGGNGKTPMVEFIALCFDKLGISPLILTRGYAGGDEARMLQGHLAGTSIKIGIGGNRAATAASFFGKYGHVTQECSQSSKADKIGCVILDDGMQHWSLSRDLEIVMVNAMAPWGNKSLLPRGPLREPLTALERADVAVIHHTNLVSYEELRAVKSTIREIKETLPIFLSQLRPFCFFDVKKPDTKLPLQAVQDSVVLCVSAIGCASSFVQAIGKIGAEYVDRIDFSDHHFIQKKDIAMIKEKLAELSDKFCAKPIVAVTEKDYYRDPDILKELDKYQVLVLSSALEIMPSERETEDSFKHLLKTMMDDVREQD
ncbi:probable tetraacyldisaccharide 4'-kinase, mitochondrial isoform X2 [Aristolochia californica]|uniref:probable tetraacyldisaccharide 4'-kinase, mitochondrial isoform X2 n=1 Tax=Aristolochia californica TaxID=171875 RepID=UPI0035D9EBFD